MRTPETTFQEVWHSKVRATPDSSYARGRNLRVDEAIRTLSGGRRLLDIGCGAGVLGRVMKSSYAEVYGVDIASDAVQLASNNGVVATRVNLNCEALPYEAGYFDSVTALSVFQYFYDPEHVLRECYRVLVPKGELLLSVPNMRCLSKVFRLMFVGRFPQSSKAYLVGYDGGVVRYFCAADVVQLLNQVGFSVNLRKGIFCRPKFFDRVPNSLWLFSFLKNEFLSGEVFIRALRLS